MEAKTAQVLVRDSKEHWANVPEDKRKKCIAHLKKTLKPELIEDMRRYMPVGLLCVPMFHFGQGMAIRNLLRQVMPDEELPKVEYEGVGQFSNWDDYYMGAIAELLGG